MSMMIGSID